MSENEKFYNVPLFLQREFVFYKKDTLLTKLSTGCLYIIDLYLYKT